MAPEQYEIDLLEQYAQGALSLDEVLTRLDERVYHVLYRSRATTLLSAAQLTDLLEESKQWNMQHGITGLLCYSSDGHFVQVIEGTASEVKTLFARIRQDQRHHQVVALSEKASDKRWFADWQMALVQLDSCDFYWLLGYLEAQGHNLVLPQTPITDTRLLQLLKSFSKT